MKYLLFLSAGLFLSSFVGFCPETETNVTQGLHFECVNFDVFSAEYERVFSFASTQAAADHSKKYFDCKREKRMNKQNSLVAQILLYNRNNQVSKKSPDYKRMWEEFDKLLLETII
jgi:hypothetical protein